MAAKLKRKQRCFRPRKSLFKSWFFWLAVLFIILLGVGFYFFVFFKKFQIQEIRIFGNEKILSQEIENTISGKVNKEIFSLNIFFSIKLFSKSIFLVNKRDLAEGLLKQFPGIEEVKIKKKYPDVLSAEIKERRPFAAFCQPEQCFFIDSNGVIFETVEPQDLIIRYSDSKKSFSLGQEAIKKDLIDLIVKIKNDLKENFQIEIKEASVGERRLDIKTNEGWQIYFSLENDTDLQITKLDLLLKQEVLPASRQKLEYIDLRSEIRIYYK